MKKIYLGLGGIISIASPIALVVSCTNEIKSTYPKEQALTITAIHDGDTLNLSDGSTIRLMGFDSAELSNYINGKWIQTTGRAKYWGIQARDFLRTKYLKHVVIANYEEGVTYDRQVAKLSSGGKDLALEMVIRGLGRVGYISIVPSNKYYTTNTFYYKELKRQETIARNKHIGIWASTEDLNVIYASKPHITS